MSCKLKDLASWNWFALRKMTWPELLDELETSFNNVSDTQRAALPGATLRERVIGGKGIIHQ